MSLLEQIRQNLEELDAIELCIVQELNGPKHKSRRGQLAQEHRVASSLYEGEKRARFALDAIPQLQNEQQQQPSSNNSTTIIIQELEQQIQQRTSTMNNRNNNNSEEFDIDPFEIARSSLLATAHPSIFQLEPLSQQATRVERKNRRKLIDELVLEGQGFLGEEHFGKYVDVHHQHEEFQNLGDEYFNTSYLTFIQSLATTGLVPLTKIEKNKEKVYVQFLRSLLDYFESFLTRTHPLRKYIGENNIIQESSSSLTLPLEEELKKATSANELLVAYGKDVLKAALAARGMLVGGTGEQRAERLFNSKFTTTSSSNVNMSINHDSNEMKIPLTKYAMEKKIKTMAMGELAGILEATRVFITGKFTMTFEEIAKSEQFEEEPITSSDDEAHGHLSSNAAAKKANHDDELSTAAAALLGASAVVDPSTGQIIPKWMFRLHGLHLEFKCEICGNATYYGRRNFDRHFKEARHSAGMKALDIPNTSHFMFVTKIDDAKQLYAKLKAREGGILFRNTATTTTTSSSGSSASHREYFEEEVEDEAGNILSKKALLDLKRQGLL
jgi:splicing factor 3A subunit 3